MELEKIDHIYTLKEITEIVDGLFGTNDRDYYNISENGVVLNGLRKPKECALKDKIRRLFLEIRQINLWLTGQTIDCYKPPTLNEIKEKENERKIKYKELSALINPDIIIPDNILNKLQQEGFIEDTTTHPLQWLKSKTLLAYFVDVANEKLNIKKSGGRRIIKPFETLFNISKITGLINDYRKIGTLPQGYKDIDNIFNTLN